MSWGGTLGPDFQWVVSLPIVIDPMNPYVELTLQPRDEEPTEEHFVPPE